MSDQSEVLLWLRNPALYIKECKEVGVRRIVWDAGVLKKRGMDLNRFMDLYYGTQPWEAMIISTHGAQIVDSSCTQDDPKYCFPVWEFGQPTELLVDYLERPVVGRQNYRSGALEQFRPKEGQPHWVVVTYLPSAKTQQGKDVLLYLSQLQQEYPEAVIHVHGLYGFPDMFGLQFRSVDYEARNDTVDKKIILPTGTRRKLDRDEPLDYKHWIELLGYTVPQLLDSPRDRCMFNIKAAMWAARHFKENVRFRRPGFKYDENEDLEDDKTVRQDRRIFLKNIKPLETDKFYCSTCSLMASCKYYREGAVCVVPDSEPADLVSFFKTRDADSIMQGMALLLQVEAERVSQGRQAELEREGLSAEVTKMIDKMFNHAEKLAKLSDPRLRSHAASMVPPGTVNNIAVLSGGSSQELASQVFNMLLSQGVPAEKITPDVVMELIQGPGDLEEKAIQTATTLRMQDAQD